MSDTHPAHADHYPTPVDALTAGVRLDLDDYVDRWHEGASEAPLSVFLGMTEEEYAAWAMNPNVLDSMIQGRRDRLNGPIHGPFQMRFGIPASAQTTSFANATLSALESGHAMSVSLIPPADLPVEDSEMLRTMLKATFRRLIDTGWAVEFQVGPDDENAPEPTDPDEEAPDFDIDTRID